MTVTRHAVHELPMTDARPLKIALSHPHGNANSYNAALAFSENRWLQRFQTGILASSRTSRVTTSLSADLNRRAQNRGYEEIPEAEKETHFTFETLSRVGRKVMPGGLTSRVNWYDVLFSGHDFLVSRTLRADLDAVYAYEDGARRTFEAARRSNITAIYELPLGYYEGVACEINRARTDWPDFQPGVYSEPEWKRSRKDAELRLADVIVVASEWARNSLRFSDACSERAIVKIPYGTPAGEVFARQQQPAGQFTVLFAGLVGLRKGAPHLIEAWEKLALKDARLLLAGSINLPRDYMNQHVGSFDYLGAKPRVELLEVMKKVDLFVFPSLAEGFGLVIGEAMACGVPVLTTQNTGGPELIADGVEGWCVQAHSIDPLIERIEWAYRHRDELFEMGSRARQRAERWTWADYRRKLVAELAPFLISQGADPAIAGSWENAGS
jgi:glycosyltransferase involved in cell wall biosynthesis